MPAAKAQALVAGLTVRDADPVGDAEALDFDDAVHARVSALCIDAAVDGLRADLVMLRAARAGRADRQPGCRGAALRAVHAAGLPGRPGGGPAVSGDGPDYASIRSLRQRDRVVPEQLERRGWKFMRVWSTDAFVDPQAEYTQLEK